MRELDSAEVGDSLGPDLEEIDHRKIRRGQGRDVVVEKQQLPRRRRDGTHELNELVDPRGLEEERRQGRDGGGGDLPRVSSQRHRITLGVVPDVNNDLQLCAGDIDPAPGDGHALVQGERHSLAGRPANECTAHPGTHQRRALLLHHGEVHIARCIERRIRRRDQTVEPKTIHPSPLEFNEKSPGGGSATAAPGAIPDSRGYGLHGTAEGAPLYVAGDPRYGNTSALRFTSGADLVRIPEPANQILDFEAGDSFTIEADFRTTAHGGSSANESGPLVSKDVGSLSASYWLRVETGKLRFLVSDGTHEPSVMSSISVNDGNWHHVAAERDAGLGELRLYVDYNLVGAAPDTTIGGVGNANDLLIGAFNNATAGTKQFIGDIDWIRDSSGALAPADFVQPVPEPAVATIGVIVKMFVARRSRKMSA